MSSFDVSVKTALTQKQAMQLYDFVGNWHEVMGLALLSLHGIDFDVLLTSARVGVGGKELSAILDSLRRQK